MPYKQTDKQKTICANNKTQDSKKQKKKSFSEDPDANKKVLMFKLTFYHIW